MICVIHAHPYPSRSRANRALAEALRALPDLDLRSLYGLYPDFDIDVEGEQQALLQARLVVWMHPLYWYSVPALLKHWFDKVLAFGWAYGNGSGALSGKHCLWVPTAGGDAETYTPSGMHAHPLSSYATAIEQTARFCGMQWETPHVVYGADDLDESELSLQAAALVQRLSSWRVHANATPLGAAS
jgi:glutathione-regulated potassium-efflux system ancillary protein KefF